MTTTAVLFDMDGVLVDSEHYWVEREREEILPRAVPDQRVEVSEITGMNYRDIYDYLAEEYDVALDREEWIAMYEAAAEAVYGDRAALLTGVRDLLADLREAGVRTAIVSSSPPHWIEMVLERFDLADYFDRVVSAETVDVPGKPEPDIFEAAASDLGVDPAECVVVEDSEHGVAAAVASGATVVGYYSGADADVDLSAADVSATDPETLLAEVRRLALGGS